MRTILLAMLLTLAACGSDAGADDTVDFATGEFTVLTTVVDDRCLDGGLNLLFMPNGEGTPWEWPFPVRIHGADDLPTTYTIQLREPFGEMTVTAEDAGVDLQTLVSETNSGVLLGSQFGECVVDIDATVQVQYVDPDSATGIAQLGLSNPRGDDRCPVDMPAACDVVLSFEAERQ